MLDERTLKPLCPEARSQSEFWTSQSMMQRWWRCTSSQQAKTTLLPALSPGNIEKTMSAPVTAVLAHDTRFVRRAAQ